MGYFRFLRLASSSRRPRDLGILVCDEIAIGRDLGILVCDEIAIGRDLGILVCDEIAIGRDEIAIGFDLLGTRQDRLPGGQITQPQHRPFRCQAQSELRTVQAAVRGGGHLDRAAVDVSEAAQHRVEKLAFRVEQEILRHSQPGVQAAFGTHVGAPGAPGRDLEKRAGQHAFFPQPIRPPRVIADDAARHQHIRIAPAAQNAALVVEEQVHGDVHARVGVEEVAQPLVEENQRDSVKIGFAHRFPIRVGVQRVEHRPRQRACRSRGRSHGSSSAAANPANRGSPISIQRLHSTPSASSRQARPGRLVISTPVPARVPAPHTVTASPRRPLALRRRSHR